MPPPRKPRLFDLEGEADPSAAPPVPDGSPEALAEGRAMQAAANIALRRASPLTRLAGWVFGALFSFVLSVAAWDFITGLLTRNAVLGSIALVLLSLAGALALVMVLREFTAFLRLGRLDKLRAEAEAAHEVADLAQARGVVAGLEKLYASRPDLRWGLTRLGERRAEVFDADGLLNLAETELLGNLDQAARREIELAARQVATVTALVPLALADVAMALVANLRMIRRIAEIYGGRAGSFGSWRLLKRVFTYLIATGAVALTDDMIGSVAGGGMLSKVSRRFGEGVVNGALTARVGLAAMELCRPMPFVALPRPKVTNLVSRALAGLFGSRAAPEETGGQA
ncbi:YcjF family protein [Rhodobacter ferrooxidans]|nr:TIGR01620 family protein [Rhodobacter sp. SW2]